MPSVLCLMPDALCPQSNKGVLVRASREVLLLRQQGADLMPGVLSLMPYVLSLMSYVMCLMSHAVCPQSNKGVLVRASRDVSVYSVNKERTLCLMSDVSCLMSDALCLMSHALCLTPYV